MPEATPREEAASALKQADRATRRGDLAQAERWSKTAERLAASAERLAALPQPMDDGQDEEARRAELRQRIMRFAEDTMDEAAWEREREIYEAKVFAALANNLDPPDPLPPRPTFPRAAESYTYPFTRMGEE